jgi:DNA-binding Lrp family transcriptional regulator
MVLTWMTGNEEIEESLSKKQRQILGTLFAKSKQDTIYNFNMTQAKFAKQLNISRQALSIHFHKLREEGFIRTGRGFIIITEKGLRELGKNPNPAFVFVKISPLKRDSSYSQIMELPVQRIFRVAGDMDAILIVEQEKLEKILIKLTSINGIQATKSFVVIKSLK